jgi:hypothetical protein
MGSPIIARNGRLSFASESLYHASLRRQIVGQIRASWSSDVIIVHYCGANDNPFLCVASSNDARECARATGEHNFRL